MRTQLFVIFVLIMPVVTSCTTREPEIIDPNEAWSFVVFSDPQQGFGVYSQLAKRIAALKPAPLMAFCCGDVMLRPANEVEWLNFRRYSEPITQKMPFYMARGNHEGNDQESEELLQEQQSFPDDDFYYSIRRSETLLIILDTYIKSQEQAILGDQLNWLKTILNCGQSDSTVSQIFVLMHQPLFPQGFHQGSNLLNAEELHRMFVTSSKLRGVFAGHDHMFNRFVKDGVTYITTGGAGGYLYNGYGGDYHHFTKITLYDNSVRINIKTIGIFNEVVEDFNL